MDNPYAPPQSTPDAIIISQPLAGLLASRWARLGAALIDSFIGSVFSVAFAFMALGLNLKTLGTASVGDRVIMLIAGLAFFVMLHGYLLARNGQTIGKFLLRIRIANLDGGVPGLMPLLLKRYMPIWLISQLPFVGALISLIDILFIFKDDKRCIHDWIAGTKVVKVA